MSIIRRTLVHLDLLCDHEWEFIREYDCWDLNWIAQSRRYRVRRFICKYCCKDKEEILLRYKKEKP